MDNKENESYREKFNLRFLNPSLSKREKIYEISEREINRKRERDRVINCEKERREREFHIQICSSAF